MATVKQLIFDLESNAKATPQETKSNQAMATLPGRLMRDRTGLLWLAEDDNILESLPQAVKRFREKFGRLPGLIEVNINALNGKKEYKTSSGIVVRSVVRCPPGHAILW